MVTLISGTNRPGSRALAVARQYQQLLQARGIAADLLSLADLPADFLLLDPEDPGHTPEYRTWAAKIQQTQLFIFVVPEYNGSYPGILKVLIDALPPKQYFHGKKAALVGVSTGRFGNLRGLDHLSGVLGYVQVELLPYRAHLMHVHKGSDAEGQLSDASLLKELHAQLDKLIPVAQALAAPSQVG